MSDERIKEFHAKRARPKVAPCPCCSMEDFLQGVRVGEQVVEICHTCVENLRRADLGLFPLLGRVEVRVKEASTPGVETWGRNEGTRRVPKKPDLDMLNRVLK